MLKEGDLATLLMQNEDNTENIKISGVVKHVGDIGVHMSVCGSSKVFIIEGDCCYKVTSIKRPVENMLPDSPGLWKDSHGCSWAVNHEVARMVRDDEGNWLANGAAFHLANNALDGRAPFTKINIIEEKVSNEQA